jgi:hypothetical protein
MIELNIKTLKVFLANLRHVWQASLAREDTGQVKTFRV